MHGTRGGGRWFVYTGCFCMVALNGLMTSDDAIETIRSLINGVDLRWRLVRSCGWLLVSMWVGLVHDHRGSRGWLTDECMLRWRSRLRLQRALTVTSLQMLECWRVDGSRRP